MNENILTLVWLQKSGNCSRGHWLREGVEGSTQQPPSGGKINIRPHPKQTLCVIPEADALNETHVKVLDQNHTHTAS